jgi:hypothetical protein
VWFKEYNYTVGVYNIIVGDIYNYNKIGVRLGIGKKEKVINKFNLPSDPVPLMGPRRLIPMVKTQYTH